MTIYLHCKLYNMRINNILIPVYFLFCLNVATRMTILTNNNFRFIILHTLNLVCTDSSKWEKFAQLETLRTQAIKIRVNIIHDTKSWSQYQKHLIFATCRKWLIAWEGLICIVPLNLHVHTICACTDIMKIVIHLTVYRVTAYVPSNWESPAAAPVLPSGGLVMLGCLLHLYLNDAAPGWYAAPEQDSQVSIYYRSWNVQNVEKQQC